MTAPADRSREASNPATPASPPADAEWLLTDGAGGYACGTVADLPDRRYHGWWIARLPGETGRRMIVAGVDERIGDGAAAISLLHARWRGLPGPVSPPVATGFQHRPLPTWSFRGDGLLLERSIALWRVEAGGPGLLVRWRNAADRPLRLGVRLLCGGGNVDHLGIARDGIDAEVEARGASWGLRLDPAVPKLWVAVDGIAAYRAEPVWYRGFLYGQDRDRGYDHVGDRLSPGVLELDLPPGAAATVAVALGEPCPEPAAAFVAAAAEAGRRWREAAGAERPRRARLALGADDFLYRADGGRLGVLAGFPWFGEWGRDVFIALPGLTLARGLPGPCRDVLAGAVPFLRRGLLPNVYGSSAADSHYDSCDAALWFALAVARFADAGHDPELVGDLLLPALAGIADSYIGGTDLGLAVGDDGLLRAGRPDLNATWMDARVGTEPVTPRAGLPVEIEALWCALLSFLVERGERRFEGLCERAGKSFVAQFWQADGSYLADCVTAGAPDRSVRPNMLVAAALRRSPLSAAQRRGVVKLAAAELVTPVGLRTLSPRDPRYAARYGGDAEARDRAYHQGTVWPWLAGFYVEAELQAATRPRQAAVRRALAAWLDGILLELDRAGLDHVSEVFDGDPPHRPGGTFAQAWNTGELLRALELCSGGGG